MVRTGDWWLFRGQPACASARARAVAGLEPAVDRLLAIYAAAIAGPHQTAGASQAAARHLARIARPLKDAYNLSVVARDLGRDLELARRERDAETLVLAYAVARARQLETDVDQLQVPLATPERELEAARNRGQDRLSTLERELKASDERAKCLDADLAAYRSLPTLRLRDALLRVPVLGRLLQIGARRCANVLDRRRPTAR